MSLGFCDYNRLKSFGFGVSVGDILSGLSFRSFWPRLPGLGHQPLDGNYGLKFSLETRLKSESFELLISFKAFGSKVTARQPQFW